MADDGIAADFVAADQDHVVQAVGVETGAEAVDIYCDDARMVGESDFANRSSKADVQVENRDAGALPMEESQESASPVGRVWQ